jgi:LysM repeat protein/lysophospholipase L1-like esterase
LNKLLKYLLLLFGGFLWSQEDSLAVPIDTVAVVRDSSEIPLDISNFEPFNNVIQNEKGLNKVFEKLYQLEQKLRTKVRIVQIGDSHIQADLYTAKMRQNMQGYFGNGGFGFTFPYSVAGTNNSAPIKYTATGNYTSARNLFASSEMPVGLSGIALQAKTKKSGFTVSVKDAQYYFNKLKLITPQNKDFYGLVSGTKTVSTEVEVPAKITHTVKKGEVLGTIASNYNVSLAQLKKANGLKKNTIRDGKVLVIPTKQTKTKTKTAVEVITQELQATASSHEFVSEKLEEKVSFSSKNNEELAVLNGIILENNASGITFSGIGVNGAKISDYNKFPLFYEQLPALEADLFVISLGTNDSYDLQDQERYYKELKLMLDGIKGKCPEASVLVATPPPSLLHRKSHNGYIEIYSELIQNHADNEDYAVWNLLDVFGGNKNLILNYRMGLMAKDKVHYSKLGYEKQADLFFGAFIQSYELYKSQK